MEFKYHQKQYVDRQWWAHGWFVAFSGDAMFEMIEKHIRQQDGSEPGDGGKNILVP
jgi:putative transposase